MAPCKPVRSIKVHVPRHNSQRIGPAMTAQVEIQARAKRMRVEVRQTAYESTSALAQAIESASEWNSLLMTARAERGPQWDVGTQQFLVDELSELYYDPSTLQAAQRTALQEEGEESAPPAPSPMNLSFHSERQRHHPSEYQNSPRPTRSTHLQHNINHMNINNSSHHPSQAYPGSPGMAMVSPRHGYPGGPQVMGYTANGIPPSQLYGGVDGASMSPMRMGMNPAASMNMGMNMGMGGMGMGVGMGMGRQPEGMGSPDPRRRITRGMSAEDYGGMH